MSALSLHSSSTELPKNRRYRLSIATGHAFLHFAQSFMCEPIPSAGADDGPPRSSAFFNDVSQTVHNLLMYGCYTRYL